MVSLLIVIGYIIFVLVLIAGVLAPLVGLPGTILILLDALGLSIFTHWHKPGWIILLILLLLSLLAETSDNLLSLVGTRYGGGTGKTGLYAMLGGIGGALAGSWLSPLVGALGLLGGVAGFLVGVVLIPLGLAFVGGYLAAYWYERRQGRDRAAARKAGLGALLGRLVGAMAKSLIAAIMAGILLYTAFHGGL